MTNYVYIVLMFAVPARENDSGDIMQVFKKREDAKTFVKEGAHRIKDFARYEIIKEKVY